jgi:hypothetical protein
MSACFSWRRKGWQNHTILSGDWMESDLTTKMIIVNSGRRYGPGTIFYLDTPIYVSTKDGKKSAKWSNYRFRAVFYLLIYSFGTYLILSTLLLVLASHIIFYLTGSWISLSLRNYFDADWVPAAILALFLSIFPFSQTWPTIFSQLKSNPRRAEINQNDLIFYDKGTAKILPKAKTRITYGAADLFGRIPFKVVTFYFDSNGAKIPFYQVVMKFSFSKNESYRNEFCDVFAQQLETEFDLLTSK